MELFKFGLRNILGISIPGAIIIVIFAYVVEVLATFFKISFFYIINIGDKQILAGIIAFIFSYVIGSLIRLIAADHIDEKSSAYYIRKNRQLIEKVISEMDKNEKNSFKQNGHVTKKDSTKILTKILLDKLVEVRKLAAAKLDNKNDHKWYSGIYEFDKWIFFVDIFPYSLWEFRKFEKNLPREFLNFFKKYKNPMLTESKDFFNYCKMVVISDNISDHLKDEINGAEAFTRFLAGTYFASIFSISFLIICILIQITFIFLKKSYFLSNEDIFSISISVALIFTFLYARYLIISRFRNIRLKEVDIVYDAFYLVKMNSKNISK